MDDQQTKDVQRAIAQMQQDLQEFKEEAKEMFVAQHQFLKRLVQLVEEQQLDVSKMKETTDELRPHIDTMDQLRVHVPTLEYLTNKVKRLQNWQQLPSLGSLASLSVGN